MKHIFTFVFFYATCLALHGQEAFTKAKAKLEKINTFEDATALLLNKDSTIDIGFQNFSSDDTTQSVKQILTRTPGEIFTKKRDDQSYTVHKVLNVLDRKRYRIQYILFDNDKISEDRIDSLKREIQAKLDSGTSFGDLASRYSMDDSANRSGDSGWFERGQIYSEIEEAIDSHAFGAIFYVDVPAFKRHYVVKNAFKPQVERKLYTVYLKVSHQK